MKACYFMQHIMSSRNDEWFLIFRMDYHKPSQYFCTVLNDIGLLEGAYLRHIDEMKVVYL